MPEFLPHWLLVVCAWLGVIELAAMAVLATIAIASDLSRSHRAGDR